MRKTYIIVGVIAVLAIGGVIVSFLLKNNSGTASTNTRPDFTVYDACQLLTRERASELLGTSATLGQEPSPSNSDDLKVTNCVYNNNAGNFKDIVSVSVLVRSPLTEAGARSNSETFSDTSLVGDVSVDRYGEKAMWNSATGQLNVLKDKNWIIITFGKAQPNNRSLEETKNVASALLK